MCLSLQTVSFKEFSRIVYVFHCSVIKVLICSPSCDSLFTISHHFIDVNSYFLFFSNKKQENGEGGIWTLAPLLTTYSLSRGAPSATWVLLQMPDSFRDDIFLKRRGWDSNPRALSDKRFSRPPRYDRFDTSPCISHRDNWYYISGFPFCQPLFSSFFNFFRSLFFILIMRAITKVTTLHYYIYTYHTKSLPPEDLPV